MKHTNQCLVTLLIIIYIMIYILCYIYYDITTQEIHFTNGCYNIKDGKFSFRVVVGKHVLTNYIKPKYTPTPKAQQKQVLKRFKHNIL